MEELQAGDPRQVGTYRLLGRLGSGGMGRVYLAQSPGGRLVAVKVIQAELADLPDFRARFAREVAAARKVSGVFTAPVVDADPEAAAPWLATGFVDGPSLATAVTGRGPLDVPAVRALARGLAEGLAAIHAAGLVHRDLKPTNVLLAADGPRIIDFGISRAADATSMTHTGIVVGSPGFMSPEQAGGRDVGPASDMFNLGSVLAFAATGEDPFGTGNVSALLYRVVHAPPALEDVSAELRPLIERCLSKDPAQRPAPGDVFAELGNADIASSWPVPPPVPWPGHMPAGLPARGAPAANTPAAAPDPGSSDRAGQGRGHATAPTALHRPTMAASAPRHGHRLRWAWAAAATVLIAGAGTGIALASHRSGDTPQPPAASTTATATATPATPRTVVDAYFTAINARNWRRVWQLGGKNLGQTYASMVAGFHYTSRDEVTRLTVHGDSVSARIRAYESTGAVQTYALSYTVANGIIISGRQTLLTTQTPASSETGCPHIQYGADGTAGPLFCADGHPNPPVLAYYHQMHLLVLSLGPDATPGQVLQAMCSDLQQHSTYPIETAAYNLAARINGWSFGVNPADEMTGGACTG